MGNTSQMTGTRVKIFIGQKGSLSTSKCRKPPTTCLFIMRGVAACCNVTPNMRKTFVYVEDKQARYLAPRGRPAPCHPLPPNGPWAGHGEGGGWYGGWG